MLKRHTMDDLVERVDALSVKPPKISKETYLLITCSFTFSIYVHIY